MATINGTARADKLRGTGSADQIYGGLGADDMGGGGGNDTFLIKDSREHTALEWIDGGSDVDTIFFSGRDQLLTLSSFITGVEKIALSADSGNSGINATGHYSRSAIGFELSGNGGENFIRGSNYSDVIYGNAGKDWLRGLNGNDVLDGGTNADILDGGAGADRLVGGRVTTMRATEALPPECTPISTRSRIIRATRTPAI